MASLKMTSLYIIAFFLSLGLANGVLYVNPRNPQAFSTIQSAIDSVPLYNNEWVEISIAGGVYNEKITIPRHKPFIYLRAEDQARTTVTWRENGTIETSPTISFMADNAVVSGITFINSYNYPPMNNNQSWAVAARIAGDKIAFYRCSFLGFQDTLYDNSGRHYFKQCKIEGAVDFIFGNGQSIYDQCLISSNTLHIGYITAQGREDARDTGGFVFKNCMISRKSRGTTYLGRAWKEFSRVIFYRSEFPKHILPQGWMSWQSKNVTHITFVEHECHGQGSDMSNRVNWMKKLREEELQELIHISYIDKEGWIKQQPYSID